MACLPSGGATPPWSSTQHCQSPGKGPQTRKAKTSSTRLCNICLPTKVLLPIQLPEEEPLGYSVVQLAAPSLRGFCTPVEHLRSTASPCKSPHSQEKVEQAWPSHAIFTSTPMQSCQFSCPGEEPLGFSVAQLATPALGWGGCSTPVEQLPSTASPLEEPHSQKTPEQALTGHVKSASILVQTSQSCLPTGSLLCFRETLSAPPTLRKSHAASKKTDQQRQPSGNILQQCQGKPCPVTGSTTPPRKNNKQDE